jgi:methyltransferase (TIGR00027 family)
MQMSGRLPDASKSMYVAHVRYFQSRYEAAGYTNPDTLVRRLIPTRQRWRAAWLAKRERERLRGDPFYYYLLARTRHYDDVVTEAVAAGIDRIVIVGCGSDTRAYRFRELLGERRVKVLECDQAESISAKERLVRRLWDHDHVEFSVIDLNERVWQGLERWLVAGTGRALLFMEGVSPYIQAAGFREFLKFIGQTLPAGSQVAYDFKVEGVVDEFGKTDLVSEPFRLPNRREDVAGFHAEYRLELIGMETSSELCARALPRLTTSPRFSEDVLVRLEVG